MRSYEKKCFNCGLTYFSSRHHSKTCSQACRTQFHYRRKYGNRSVKTFNADIEETFHLSNVKTLNGISTENPGSKVYYLPKQIENRSMRRNVPTDDCLYDISVNPAKKLEAFTPDDSPNFFIDTRTTPPVIQTLMFKGEVYHFIGFFETDKNKFDEFEKNIASNWVDFIFLSAEIEFIGEWVDSIQIYVNQKLFNMFMNHADFSVVYDYIRCAPDENGFIYYDEESDQYLLKQEAEWVLADY